MAGGFFLYNEMILSNRKSACCSKQFAVEDYNENAEKRTMSDLKNEIHAYWTNRARGYSEYNQQEMADARRSMWRDNLLTLLGGQFT